MKLILNIFFEKLHRFVFDYEHQSTNTEWGLPTRYRSANRNNKLEVFNSIISNFYDKLCPYFDGWRASLLKKYPNELKYQRYK